MRRYLLLLICLVTLQYSYAQPNRLSFDHLSITQGLPDNNISDMIQDSRGYIWLTTVRGIVRYDGYRVKAYKPGSEDKTNIPVYLFSNTFLDKNHDLWANSVTGGLFKYDPSTDHFIQYKNEDKKLRDKKMKIVAAKDSSGKIWSVVYKPETKTVVTLQQFDPATGVFKLYGRDQKGAHYLNCTSYGLYVDKQGKVCVGGDNGFYIYDPSSDSFRGYFTTNDTLKQKAIYPHAPQKATSTPGKLWLSVKGAEDNSPHPVLMDLRSGKTEEFRHNAADENSIGNESVNTIYEDKKHRVWLGTAGGLSLYDDKANRFINYYLPADTIVFRSKNAINSILEDKDGKLWMASGYGLVCFNPETGIFKRYIHDKANAASISSNWGISKLLFDREGTLWAVTSAGVDHVNTIKSAFEALKAKGAKIPWIDVFTVRQAPGGEYWVGAQNGLYQYDKAKQTVKQISKQAIFNLWVAENGIIYYNPTDATNNADGLRVYDPKTGKTDTYKPIEKDSTSLSNKYITCIRDDHTGTIWIGTNGSGVCTFNPRTKKFKRYPFIVNDFTITPHDMMDDLSVTVIYEDKAGTIWAGGNNGGLNRYDRQKDVFVSTYKPLEGVNSITSIKQDNQGRLWVGTFFNGLFLLDKQGAPIKNLTEKDGLLSEEVTFVHTDETDFIWVVTARGFTRVNTRDYSIKNYKAAGNSWEGIFNEGSFGFWDVGKNIASFGGDNIVLFDPNIIAKDITPPLVHLENIAHSNPRSATDSAGIIETYGKKETELPWNQNKVTFNFVALHYIDPAGSRYAYQLEGYDNHWIQAGAQHSVTYTNLPPATYTFHVKAANSDGVWSTKEDSFTITILAPLWFRWWAWVLYLILFIAIIRAYITSRSRKLLHDKRVLEETVQVRTTEVIQQKEEIEAQRDDLEKAFGELKTTQTQLIQSEKMASLGELTAGIAHEIQNPLNFVNNFSEVNREMIDELKEELKAGNVEEAIAIAEDLQQNEEKITHHGKRADAIVKGMLEHSRKSSGTKQPTDINAIADEYLRLSYHGLRAKDKAFNADMTTNFDPKLPHATVIGQDIGRVLLNFYNNAFYAIYQKQKRAIPGYKPEITVATSFDKSRVYIKIKDNGDGIPDSVKDKIMQPFFTTKPTGEGTGLGLSLSYDIIVKVHGGSIDLDTKEGEYTEFTISLPLETH